MARIPIPCSHIDFPCCGCDEVILTGEDALEQIREQGLEMDLAERNRQEEEMDDRRFEVDLHDITFEDRMCGEAY